MTASGSGIVVTGHNGFVGRRLLARLPEARTPQRGIHRLEESATLEKLLDSAQVIFHLAGVNAGSGYSPPNEQMVRSNILATHGLIEGIKRFATPTPLVVLLSSIHVYDRTSYYREDGATAPVSFYGFTKLTQELLLREAAEARALDALILRASNVYGPGCRPNYNSAVATFCHRILEGIPIELMGNGRSQADLVFVDDVVDIMLRHPQLRRTGTAVYNLGSGVSVAMVNVVDLLARISGRTPVVRLLDTPPTEFAVDNTRLLSALGGFNFTDLERGLFQTYHENAVPLGGQPPARTAQ